MRKFLLFISLFSLSSPLLYSQYLRIGDQNFLGTAGGPMVNSTTAANYYSRFAYIFPKAVLGNLKHGDTITSLEFSRLAGLGLNNSCNLKIALSNTKSSDYGTGNLYWPGRLSGAVVVYDQNPSGEIGTVEGFQRIPFYNSVFLFDTSKGENLEVLVEFRQTATQPERINWYFENGSTVSGYFSNQTKYMVGATLNDTLKNSTDYHPTIIINYPRIDNDVAILKLYTLGKLPIPLGNPDSVKALVRNVGKKNQASVKLKTWIKGYNKQEDSSTFAINYGEQIFINLPSLAPAKKGLDTVFAIINNDSNKQNDTAFSFRLGNENVYSYRDVTQPPAPGGIGFNGPTGDFVARFFSNKVKYVNQITVSFAITGRPFKVGIWETKTTKAGPGKLIYLSDSLTSVAGNYVLNLKTPVSVNGTFFVGVRQLNGNNVAFGYQIEDPVRPNTFFYTSPAGDTNWFDFHPDAPFKFLIEPRIQGDTDLTVLSADYPSDTLDRYSFTTLAPKATVSNLGAKDMKDSFTVTCEIHFFGNLVYKEVLRDTMSSGQKRSYTFPNTFDPKNFGEHEMLVYTSHPADQIIDNDTARRKFYVGVKNDVMIATVYDPPNASVYECFRDTIMPVATVQNPSYNGTSNFTVRCRIMKGTTVLYNRTQIVNLPRFNSKILAFPTYQTNDTGKLWVIFTTEMANDVYRANDTQLRYVYVVKSWDVGVDSVALPDKNKIYTQGVAFRPAFRAYNDGILDAGNVMAICNIKSAYTSYVYNDTILMDVDAKQNIIEQFNLSFKPDKKGLYSIFIKLFYTGDLVKWNDSIKENFHVGYPYDYLSKQLIQPTPTDTWSVGGGPYFVKAKIQNNGYIKNGDLVPIICQIWNNNVKVYQDIKTMNLDTGVSFDLSFTNNINPVNGGENKIIVFTNYASDYYRKNDTITGTVWVTVGRDAFVKSIDTPFSSVQYEARESIIPVRATIENVGRLKMNPVSISAKITHYGTLVYSEKVDDSLNEYETKKITFAGAFAPTDSGTYDLIVYTSSAGDQYLNNDTARLQFFVAKSLDAAITTWVNPPPTSVLVEGTGNLQPEITLVQAGTDTSLSVDGKVYYFIQKIGGAVEFEDSADFTGLKVNTPLWVLSNNTWPIGQPGFYLAKAIVVAGDKFPENDTLESAFEVVVNGIKDLQQSDLKIYPNPASGWIHVSAKSEILNLSAYDVHGAEVELTRSAGNIWSTDNLSPGVYMLYCETATGRITAKFVIE